MMMMMNGDPWISTNRLLHGKCGAVQCLRTFARKYSNIDFFLKILPLKDDELVTSET